MSLCKIMNRDMWIVTDKDMVWRRRKTLPGSRIGWDWRKLKGSGMPCKVGHLHKA